MAASALQLLLAVVAAVLFSALLLLVGCRLAPRRGDPPGRASSAGAAPARGPDRPRFYLGFFTLALLCLILQLKTVLLVPWVLTYRLFLDAGAGVQALIVLGVFVMVLAVGIIYEWRKGGGEWR